MCGEGTGPGWREADTEGSPWTSAWASPEPCWPPRPLWKGAGSLHDLGTGAAPLSPLIPWAIQALSSGRWQSLAPLTAVQMFLFCTHGHSYYPHFTEDEAQASRGHRVS